MVEDDPLVAVTTGPVLAPHLVDLPPEVLFDLAVGPFVRLAATGRSLDETTVERLVESAWRSVTRSGAAGPFGGGRVSGDPGPPGRWQHGGVTKTTLTWDVVPVDKPDDVNVVIGQAHFIKTIDDLHEALVGVSPALRFGAAFCEASGPRLIRHSGNDAELVDLATRNAAAIAAGHTFVILLRDGFPLNVLNPVKAVPEVCTIFCATANPVDILVAVTPRGRGVVGVVDGEPPLGVETDADVTDRRALLRAIGYKL